MKKMMLIMTALLLTAGVWAQSGKGNNRGPRKAKSNGTDRLFNQLNLTAEQQSKVDKMQADFRKEMQKLNKNDSMTVKNQREQREALSKAHRSNMESVLTADQKKQLEQLRKSNSGMGRGSRGPGKGNGDKQFEKMQEMLKLTPAQATAVQESRTKMQADMKAIRANDKLTQEERNTAMAKLREQEQANMKKILSAEQFTQWTDMRKQGRSNGKGNGNGNGKGRGQGRQG